MVLIEEFDTASGSKQAQHYVYNQAGETQLPVIVLTGYLGAGKTTLLNYILREQRDKKLAVIENEIGEVSIDDTLVGEKVQDTKQDIVLLDNGCVCCTIRGDLVKSLTTIAEKHRAGKALDGVLIELTGMADPAPVVQSLLMVEEVCNSFYVDNVVALADAKHVIKQLDESKCDPTHKGTAWAQMAFSSMVLLNKVDLVDELHLCQIERRIKQINATATIIRCQEARVPLSKLLNVGIFNLGRVLEEQYMDEDEFKAFYEPKMDWSVSNVGIRCQGPVSLFAFQEFLDSYLDQEETAKDFLRVKAVLEIAGSASKFVVQCVHMVRTTGFSGSWEEDSPRENRIVFIGRGMQQRRHALTEGFKACIAKPLRFQIGEEVQVQVHVAGPCTHEHHGHHSDHTDHVEHTDQHASCEGHSHSTAWEEGFVVKHWDEGNAYKVQVFSGPEVLVPLDDDRFIVASTAMEHS